MFTVIDTDTLCEACCRAKFLQDAREEMDLDPDPGTRLCARCCALDRAERRKELLVLPWTLAEQFTVVRKVHNPGY